MKAKRNRQYPFGSVSSGTMRPEDLIPRFLDELAYQLKHGPKQTRETRKAHRAILSARVVDDESYWNSEQPDMDLEILFDALDCYAGPHFYFGAHPGDGADYGYWLSESWDEDFAIIGQQPAYGAESIKVNDLNEVPKGFRGEVALVNDHGNITLYNKSARKLTEVWAIV